jgi:hypothetical protein
MLSRRGWLVNGVRVAVLPLITGSALWRNSPMGGFAVSRSDYPDTKPADLPEGTGVVCEGEAARSRFREVLHHGIIQTEELPIVGPRSNNSAVGYAINCVRHLSGVAHRRAEAV